MTKTNLRPEDYAHSPAHFAVVIGDDERLAHVISSLPRLSGSATPIVDPEAAAKEERIAERIASVLDRRDVPLSDTPLHLAVRLGNAEAVKALCAGGADPSVQNAGGWVAHQEAICLRRSDIALILLRHHRITTIAKFRRRSQALAAALRRIPDFYLEIAFRFESAILPFLPRAAPSDTFRIWKRGGDLRADTTIADLDGLLSRRAERSFLFLGSHSSLLLLDRSRSTICDAFHGIDSPAGIAGDKACVADEAAYRPGLDVTAADLVPRHTWRGREREENVGEWKTRVYDVNNVIFTLKTMEPSESSPLSPDLFFPLELGEDSEGEFLVAELPDLRRRSCCERGRSDLRSSAFANTPPPRRSVDLPIQKALRRRRDDVAAAVAAAPVLALKNKEREAVKKLRPTVWLTEDFPLKTEELLPLLDILSNKMKSVRRLREILTTKFPPGTFPVKIAIPVAPAVKVVFTFTKFVNLYPPEEFFTPPSTPPSDLEEKKEEQEDSKYRSGRRWGSSRLKWGGAAAATTTTSTTLPSSKSPSPGGRPGTIKPSQVLDDVDPFAIPANYKWVGDKPRSLKPTASKWVKRKNAAAP